MKKEDIKDALYDAFRTYWETHRQIRINGQEYEKTEKYEYLQFSNDSIDMLQQVLCCDEEKKSITGTVKGYIYTGEPGSSKCISLTYSVSPADYTCEKQENKFVIQINNMMAAKRPY